MLRQVSIKRNSLLSVANSNIAVIIQARMGSNRLPGKMTYEFLGKTMLAHQLSRLKEFGIKNIIVATSSMSRDEAIEKVCLSEDIPCFRGAEDDVMKRYIDCATKHSANVIVRVGGDDPLIDPECIKSLIWAYEEKAADFIYASHREGWIYGTAAELVRFAPLKDSYPGAGKVDREHVVSYIRKNPGFTKYKIYPTKEQNRPDIFLSVDYDEDIKLVEQVFRHFAERGVGYSFTQADLIELYDSGTLTIKNKHLHEGFGD